MRPLILTLLVVTAMTTMGQASGPSLGTSYNWQPLAPAAAVQMVRDFEGNQSLNVTIAYAQPANATPSNGGYTLTAGSFQYRLNGFSGDVFVRSNLDFLTNKATFYGQPYNPPQLAWQAMSQDAAQAIAYAFVQAHFPHPEVLTLMNFVPDYCTNRTLDPNGAFVEAYTFEYYQDCSSQGVTVTGPASVQVQVDTVLGQVVAYRARAYPLLRTPVPALSANQAMQAAMNAILTAPGGSAGTITGLGVGGPDNDGYEHMLYELTFYGVGDNQTTYDLWYATVDGDTGTVLGHGFAEGIDAKTIKSKTRKPAANKAIKVRPPFKSRKVNTR